MTVVALKELSFEQKISKTIRVMVELLFLCALGRGMKDCCLMTLFSPGEASCVRKARRFLHICLPIYSNMVRKTRQPLLDEYLYPYFAKGCLGTLCLGFRFRSRLRSLRNLRCFLISERCIFRLVLTIAWLNFPVLPINFFFSNQLF